MSLCHSTSQPELVVDALWVNGRAGDAGILEASGAQDNNRLGVSKAQARNTKAGLILFILNLRVYFRSKEKLDLLIEGLFWDGDRIASLQTLCQAR